MAENVNQDVDGQEIHATCCRQPSAYVEERSVSSDGTGGLFVLWWSSYSDPEHNREDGEC